MKRKHMIKQRIEIDNRCTACNGSGVYDHNGTPPCSVCDGTGLREQPEQQSFSGYTDEPAWKLK